MDVPTRPAAGRAADPAKDPAADRALDRAKDRADDSDWVDHAVRVGLVAYGVVHLLVAYLAIRLVFGDSARADASGALDQLAQNLAGRLVLYVVGAGFVVLVLWQLLEAALGHRDEQGAKRTGRRLASVGRAVVFGALGFLSFQKAAGAGGGSGGSGGSGGTDSLTARLMALPAGPLIVGGIGVAIVVTAGVFAWQGVTEEFRGKLELSGQTGNDGRAYVLFGKVGYLAKAVAIAVVGVLFCYAAVTTDPTKSGGLDAALKQLLQQPLGGVLLAAVAVGLGCFGVFCFAWARHLER